MRIEWLHAHAFGAFRGRRFELTPGLNVFYGRNESGKSTLHAALFAAVCGLRRGKGKSKEDQAFEEQHRPWTGDGWKVTALVQLKDARRVEMAQDLDDRAHCKATDAAMGRDYTSEILNEGTPDASIWLGLGRQAFLATSCVRQAELLGVRDDPKALQECIQRAAASTEGQATAATAIARLEEFQREQVGIDKANSTKPLRRSKEDAERAELELQRAARAHTEYEHLLQREQELLLQLREVDPAGATTSGAARDLAADDDFAGRAQNACAAWGALPALVDLVGRTAEELRRDIDTLHARLPLAVAQTLSGCLDASVAADVDDAAREVKAARAGFERHASTRPADPGPSPGGSASMEEMRALVGDMSQPPPATDPQAADRLREMEAALRRQRRAATRRGTTAIVFALLGAAAILGRGVLQQLVPAAGPWAALGAGALLLCIALGAAIGWQRAHARIGAGSEAAAELQHAEVVLESQRTQQAAWEAALERARARARELGLPDEAEALKLLAAQRAQWDQAQLWRANWENILAQHVSALEPRERQLRELLEARGVLVSGDALTAFEIYRQGCEVRARERELRTQIEQRVREETNRARLLSQRRDVEERLRQVAAERGLAAADAEASAAALQQWLAGHQERLRLRDQVQTVRDGLQRVRGQIEERERTLPSVADAEEAQRAAGDELGRVLRLESTLTTTLRFLRTAQERVHRDIAPVLNAAVARWLPDVTARRYDDVRIDPQSLDVQAHERLGEWRPAALLSHGTAEQIYLLLRVALAEHLVKRGEVSPLLLDDTTVQFDRERKVAVLEALRVLAATHQIVLLTQENEVRDWARARLVPARDSLTTLDMASES